MFLKTQKNQKKLDQNQRTNKPLKQINSVISTFAKLERSLN